MDKSLSKTRLVVCGCKICGQTIPTGTGKTEHANKHLRQGKAELGGDGTKTNPYCYRVAGGSNAELSHGVETTR